VDAWQGWVREWRPLVADRPGETAGGGASGRGTAVVIGLLVLAALLWLVRDRGWLTLTPPPVAPAARAELEPLPGTGASEGGPAPAAGAGSAGATVGQPGAGTAAGAGVGAAPAAVAGPAAVLVHVRGNVRRPGVVRLPAGSRVADAIAAAGGVRPGRRTGPLNLARLLVDGEQVAVLAPHWQARAAGAPSPLPGVTSGSPAVGSGVPLVALNQAGVAELDTLPGVGPVLAQRIIEWRDAHGGFTSVEQLSEVSGIGPTRLDDIRPHVTL